MKKIKILLFALLITSPIFAHAGGFGSFRDKVKAALQDAPGASGSATVGGKPMTCSDVKGIEDHLSMGENHASSYFSHWSNQDLESGASLVKNCDKRNGDDYGNQLLSFRNRRVQAEQSEKNAIAYREQQAAIAQKEAADKKALEEKRKQDAAARDEWMKRVNECRSTKKFKLWDAEEHVINTLEAKAGLQAEIAHEKKIQRTSGVVNLSANYENGAQLVEYDDLISAAFQDYKDNGGKASSPKKVTHQIKQNPCEQIEAEEPKR